MMSSVSVMWIFDVVTEKMENVVECSKVIYKPKYLLIYAFYFEDIMNSVNKLSLQFSNQPSAFLSI